MPLAMQKQYQQGPQGPNFLKRATRSASTFMNGLLQNNSAKPLPISRTTTAKGLIEITTSEQYIKVVMDREKDVFLEYSAEWVPISSTSNFNLHPVHTSPDYCGKTHRTCSKVLQVER